MSVIALSSTGYSQDTASASQLVKNRYLITFKDNTGLIDPSNSANKVPMGKHSSGQSKEELAQTLGVNGEILNIFDALGKKTLPSLRAYEYSVNVKFDGSFELDEDNTL